MRSDRRMTLDEITVRLALPRTTVWSWIENLPVPRAEFDPRPATTLGAEPVRPTRAGTGSCDTLLRARLQAWMDRIRAGWS